MNKQLCLVLEMLHKFSPIPRELQVRMSDNMFASPNREAFLAVMNYFFLITIIEDGHQFPLVLSNAEYMYTIRKICNLVDTFNEDYKDIYHIDTVPMSILKSPGGKKFVNWLTQISVFILKFISINKFGVPRSLYKTFYNPVEDGAAIAESSLGVKDQIKELEEEKLELENEKEKHKIELQEHQQQCDKKLRSILNVSESDEQNRDEMMQRFEELEEKEKQKFATLRSKLMSVIEYMQGDPDLGCENHATTDNVSCVTLLQENISDVLMHHSDDAGRLYSLIDMLNRTCNDMLQHSKTLLKVSALRTRIIEDCESIAKKMTHRNDRDYKLAEIIARKEFPDFLVSLPSMQSPKVIPVPPQDDPSVIDYVNNLRAEFSSLTNNSFNFSSCYEEYLLKALETKDEIGSKTKSTSTESDPVENKRQRLLHTPYYRMLKKKYDKHPSILKRLSEVPHTFQTATGFKQKRRQTIDSPRSSARSIPEDRRKSCRRLHLDNRSTSTIPEQDSSFGMDSSIDFSKIMSASSSGFASDAGPSGLSQVTDNSHADISVSSLLDELNEDDSSPEMPMIKERRFSLNSVKSRLRMIRREEVPSPTQEDADD